MQNCKESIILTAHVTDFLNRNLSTKHFHEVNQQMRITFMIFQKKHNSTSASINIVTYLILFKYITDLKLCKY